MCGICGFVNTSGSYTGEQLRYIVNQMNNQIRHRGPDDEGVWVDEMSGVALGHRRLSIIDLSAEGHQPMVSFSGRYSVVFNGEIYNFNELKDLLQRQGCAPVWRGHSDTEVLLAAIEAWGIEEALKKFNGMFAFALWDKQEQTLCLARDRVGKKPLYYGRVGASFLFGSELKSLCVHPAWEGDIDRNVLTLFLQYTYIPGPYSIYKNIFKLMPGTFLVLSKEAAASGEQPMVKSYWSAQDTFVLAKQSPLQATDEECITQVDELLTDAVRKRMISDVPLGAFLSGGIDSSLIVAVMQAISPEPIKTYTIGFTEKAFNEAEYAKAVSQQLGTDHTELYVSGEEAMQVISLLPTLYDEPFADQSQIPTYLISKLIRSQVTVALSGDGGDELFAGYGVYSQALHIWNQVNLVHPALRSGLAPLEGVATLLLKSGGFRNPSLRRFLLNVLKFNDRFHTRSFEVLYKTLMMTARQPDNMVVGADHILPTLFDTLSEKKYDSLDHMMITDYQLFLPDSVLVKVDRASMAVGLEARAPLLDYRIAELAWRLPNRLKVRDGKSKWILRQLLNRYMPESLFERPKMGFCIPAAEWLRGPIKEWAQSMLDPGKLLQEGFLVPDTITTLWNEHCGKIADHNRFLWSALMFEAWLGSLADIKKIKM